VVLSRAGGHAELRASRALRLGLVCALSIAACAPSNVTTTLPATSLPASDGKLWHLAPRLGDRWAVITFFSAHCPCQDAHDARLVRLFERFSPFGVTFYGVASERDVTLGAAAHEAARRHYPFPLLRDERASFARAVGAEYATFTLVVDASGRVRYAGGIDDERTHLTAGAVPYVEHALAELVTGKTVTHPREKALGCALQTR
jgi:peroxiredoxin